MSGPATAASGLKEVASHKKFRGEDCGASDGHHHVPGWLPIKESTNRSKTKKRIFFGSSSLFTLDKYLLIGAATGIAVLLSLTFVRLQHGVFVPSVSNANENGTVIPLVASPVFQKYFSQR